MFYYGYKKEEQKELFYQLKPLFGDENLMGLYAIYQGDLCVYVGQSKNMASRLATHLSGKYKECTRIEIMEVYEEEEHTLLESEKYLLLRAFLF